MRKQLLVGGAAAVTTAAALLLGGVFAGGDDTSQAQPLSAVRLDRQGNAFALRARETGDAAYYGKAEAVYRRALRVEPDDEPRPGLHHALSGRAS